MWINHSSSDTDNMTVSAMIRWAWTTDHIPTYRIGRPPKMENLIYCDWTDMIPSIIPLGMFVNIMTEHSCLYFSECERSSALQRWRNNFYPAHDAHSWYGWVWHHVFSAFFLWSTLLSALFLYKMCTCTRTLLRMNLHHYQKQPYHIPWIVWMWP